MKQSFEEWMEQVNAIIKEEVAGMDADDLPDYGYADAYDRGESAKSVARKAVKAADGF
jgi:hypothetical protein